MYVTFLTRVVNDRLTTAGLDSDNSNWLQEPKSSRKRPKTKKASNTISFNVTDVIDPFSKVDSNSSKASGKYVENMGSGGEYADILCGSLSNNLHV